MVIGGWAVVIVVMVVCVHVWGGVVMVIRVWVVVIVVMVTQGLSYH